MSDTEVRATFTSFEQSTKDDWALMARHLPVTQAMAGENIIEQMRMLAGDHGGFPDPQVLRAGCLNPELGRLLPARALAT